MFSLRWALFVAPTSFLRSIASPAGAPIPSSVAASLASQNAESHAPSLSIPPIVLNNTNITSVPGAWHTSCNTYGGAQCVVYCSVTDTACQATGNALASSCAPSWNSWWGVMNGGERTGTGWHIITTTEGKPAHTLMSRIPSYTSFSTARGAFVRWRHGDEGQLDGATTFTPVYALGSPVMVVSSTTFGDGQETYTIPYSPKPTCSYVGMSAMDATGCGKCTISGGTVDLYFWPPATSGSTVSDAQTMSTVLDGSTLISPTVYISLRTAYAEDGCSRLIGTRHTATLVAVDPAALSTQIQIGGKVLAWEYGQVHYVDLTGLPPVTEYQAQPSCTMFGCPTMYAKNHWFPTLKVPPQIRSIDPAWSYCGLDRYGLYDPPIALQPRAAAASPTKALQAETTPASPSSTQSPVLQTDRNPPVSTADPASQPYNNAESGPTSTATTIATALVLATTRVVSIDYPDSQTSRALGHGESDSTSTSTARATALIFASTRVISIDYSDNAKASSLSRPRDGHTRTVGVSAESSDEDAPTALLDPTALPNGNGVVVGAHTLMTGQAITLGSGSSKTTLSLQTQASGKETLLAFGTSDLIVIDPTGVSVGGPISDLYELPQGDYRIGTQTLGAGSVVTATEGRDRVTYSMFTRGSITLFALGTTRTLDITWPSSSTAGVDGADLALTQNPDGNFMLDGTTLLPGKPVTIGSGREKTTLAIATVQSGPAIVIDGSVTERLTHPPISTNSTLPRITHAPSAATSAQTVRPVESSPSSTISDSGAPKRVCRAAAILICIAALVLPLVG